MNSLNKTLIKQQIHLKLKVLKHFHDQKYNKK